MIKCNTTIVDIDDLYSHGDQYKAQASAMYKSRMNPHEKLYAMGSVLCRISDLYDANASITDVVGLEAALGYLWDVYSFTSSLYGELLRDRLITARDNENFSEFVTLEASIPNNRISEQAKEMINSFKYGLQLRLLTTSKEIDTLLIESNLTELTDYQNHIHAIYKSDPDPINYSCYLLIRYVVLNDYLKKYKRSSEENYDDILIKDLIFVTNGLKHIYLTTQDNYELQELLKLSGRWNDFATLVVKLLKMYDLQELEIDSIINLNLDNMTRTLRHLTTVCINQTLAPKYFLPAVKPEPKFLEDTLGLIMRNNYNKGLRKPRIFLQHIDVKSIPSILERFESTLTYSFAVDVLTIFLSKAKLLQQKYIEECFSAHSDLKMLLEYYLKYAKLAEQTDSTTNRSTVNEYYFQVAEFLAHRYYHITGQSIPPLYDLENDEVTSPPRPGPS